MSDPILIGQHDQTQVFLLPGLANRHGLITGATGTGKTVSLQVLAEKFSRMGVPSFMADVKGDLTGLGCAGADNPKLQDRLKKFNLPAPQFGANPVVFWDVFGEQGHPLRATISDMGPLLLSRILSLNSTQEGVLQMVFKIADDNGLLLLDTKDLRSMLQYVGDNAKQFTTQYGNVSTASIGAIQRALLALDQQGGDRFFGEPMLDISDLMRTDANGHGTINILAADKLMNSPRLYGCFLLWLLAELFEHLPEVGDPEQPNMVFFFDEAHLLFDEAPEALLQKIEQVVRLIRSKGVGVYFVTQNPLDIPETVLGQLGNRIQHALRSFTPRDQKAVKSAATTMRQNPAVDAEKAIGELGVGEALVSTLDEKGRPNMLERVYIVPPGSRIGPATADERTKLRSASPMGHRYDQMVDRESAFEMLRDRAGEKLSGAPAGKGGEGAQGGGGFLDGLLQEGIGTILGTGGGTGRGRSRETVISAAAKSAARSVGSGIGRAIVRGILGSLTGRGR